MANNIKGNAPNAVVARQTVSFATAGITALNTEIVYLVDDPLKSYVPGRSINGISGFETGKGYYLVAKTDMDLSTYLIPPIAGLTQLSTPSGFTASPASSTQINLSWSAVANATSYVIDRATNSGFTTGVTLAIYNSSGTSFNNTGLTASTTYYYRIRAVGSGYYDSAYANANATTNSSGATLQPLTFTTAHGLVYNSGGNYWTGTDTAGTWSNYGLANKKLAAGTDGYIQWRFTASPNGRAAQIGFRTDNVDTNYVDYKASFYAVAYGDVLGYYDNGTGGVLSSISVGDYMRVIRTGSVIKAQISSNGTTWTDVYTFTYSSTADLYVSATVHQDFRLYEPQGYNLIDA